MMRYFTGAKHLQMYVFDSATVQLLSLVSRNLGEVQKPITSLCGAEKQYLVNYLETIDAKF